MTIAAVDPGSTTGVAWIQESVSEKNLHRSLWSGGDEGDVYDMTAPTEEEELEVADAIVEELIDIQADTIIIEDFILKQFNMSRALLAPVRMGCYLRALLLASGLECQVHMQAPGSRSVITDDRLKRLNLWFPGSKHKRDAVKHLAVYLRKQ